MTKQELLGKSNKQFYYYFYFIYERMNVFWRKYYNETLTITDGLLEEHVYTKDETFQDYKFTNVYRSLDRVSQYMLKEVIKKTQSDEKYTKEDLIWRIIVFKHFNLPSTWESVLKEQDVVFNRDNFKSMLDVLDKHEDKLYNNAFMLYRGFSTIPKTKEMIKKYNITETIEKKSYRLYLTVLFEMLNEYLMKDILNTNSLEEIYNKFLEVPMFGNFLAMQFTTDLNYTDIFKYDENSFVVASVGSKRGIDKCFTGKKNEQDYVDIIKSVKENFWELSEHFLDEKPRLLPNYDPSLMDLQNCFCETDKYLRNVKEFANGMRIKQKYHPIKEKIEYIFPKWWNVKF